MSHDADLELGNSPKTIDDIPTYGKTLAASAVGSLAGVGALYAIGKFVQFLNARKDKKTQTEA